MKILDFFNRSENRDERIKKASNEIAAKLAPLSLLLVVVGLLAKLMLFDFTLPLVIVELVILVYLVILGFNWFKLNLPMKLSTDEAIHEVQVTYLSNFMYGTLYTYIFMEVLLLILTNMPISQLIWYILVWFPIAVIYSYKTIKEGLYVWGSKKQKKTNMKNFKSRVVIGSLVFGLFMSSYIPMIVGRFTWMSLLWTPVFASLWGIPFYFIMKAMVKFSEHKAEKNING